MIDFASVTYHPMLTLTQSERLENLQKRAFKIIYGYNSVYEDMLAIKSFPRLDERREEMFVKFGVKASGNNKVKDRWFPLKEKTPHNTRCQKKYK